MGWVGLGRWCLWEFSVSPLPAQAKGIWVWNSLVRFGNALLPLVQWYLHLKLTWYLEILILYSHWSMWFGFETQIWDLEILYSHWSKQLLWEELTQLIHLTSLLVTWLAPDCYKVCCSGWCVERQIYFLNFWVKSRFSISQVELNNIAFHTDCIKLMYNQTKLS